LEIAKEQDEIDRDRMIFVASISTYSHFNIARYLINGQKTRLISLEEYQKCVQLMDSDDIIHKQVNAFHTLNLVRQRLEHWHHLLHILAKVIDSNLHSFDQKTFDKPYLDLENFFFSHRLEVRQISLLNNFKMANDISREIDLSDNVSIRRPTTDELAILRDIHHSYRRNQDILILER
jgi:hypothetical protein